MASTKAAALPYDFDLDDFSPEEIDEAMQMTDDIPVKRGMCRSGFIYQAITRDCIPSLGVKQHYNFCNYIEELPDEIIERCINVKYMTKYPDGNTSAPRPEINALRGRGRNGRRGRRGLAPWSWRRV